MTISQLYQSVAQLGFEDSLENEERFIFAANRALLQVNALRPATSSYIINHKPMNNMADKLFFEPMEKVKELCFYADNVKSYYFEADGNGSVFIEKKSDSGAWSIIGEVQLISDKTFKSYRGFIKDDGEFVNAHIRLRFTGNYVYSVKCVAMYEYLYSDNEEDIPAYEAFSSYDISELVSDFLSLVSPPISENEGIMHLNQGYDIDNGRTILLPYNMRGLYKVVYNRQPKKITSSGAAQDDNSIIDLDEELCALLPLLVASYIWVEDEPEKAQYYLMLYKERAVDIERRLISAKPVQINSINGW